MLHIDRRLLISINTNISKQINEIRAVTKIILIPNTTIYFPNETGYMFRPKYSHLHDEHKNKKGKFAAVRV